MTSSRIALAAGLLSLSLGAHAQSDAKLYIVQLADAPAATYTGGVTGMAATRPAAGAKLSVAAPNVKAYASYLDIRRSLELRKAGLQAVAPAHTYRYVFNGFSAMLTDKQAQALKKSSGVAAVTESKMVEADTTRTPAFLGLSTPGGLWSKTDGSGRSVLGEDIIIGVIDTGVWPENASFGDKQDAAGNPVPYYKPGTLVYNPLPPGRFNGICQTGEGFTAAMCNNKLVGARYYAALLGSRSVCASLEYRSPRDGGGHGSHTASTAGGNAGVSAAVNGTAIGKISGMAPRARIAVYKALWNTTCSNGTGTYADLIKAIDDAVADGVDVINYSISGTLTDFTDPAEQAFLNATAAGVFVAASAGNSGPGNQVAHMSPWLTTVAASTHDRQALADLNLGNGAVYSNGASVYSSLLSAPMVLARDIPAPGAAVADAQRCFAGTLSSSAAVGKIVVCDRGVSARVDKSAEVGRVGGVGMVLVNVSSAANGLVADFHTVPTIHLPLATRTPIYAYVSGAGAGANGSISPPATPPAVVAPVMADFSSRGPNIANPNILKPDITAPGVDILAAYIDDSAAQQAQRDATAANLVTPAPNAQSLQGTSMSSPHIAGLAALLKQKYPTWSPAAIKSALMTTTTGVKLASGLPDPDRWGYGAGHVSPTAASGTPLVYDASPADYGRFMCGLGLTPPAGIGTCATLGSVQPWNLNLPSLTAASVPGVITLTRTVTNVSGAAGNFTSSATLPGFNVSVVPASLAIPAGGTATFNVTLTRNGAALNTWSFGSLTWTNGVTNVTSPLSAQAIGFLAPAQVNDVRASGKGTKVVPITSAYTGTLGVSAVGLVPATRTSSSISTGQTQCFNFAVGAGADLVRFQLFNTDTQGGAATDLDLDVFNGPGGTGTKVGSSGSGSSDETVTLNAPAAGTYSACVIGFATGGGTVSYTMSSWVVGPAAGTQSLKASAPTNVFAGGAASVGLGWNVPAGARYLGNVSYFDTTGGGSSKIGSTVVFVDNR